MIKVHCEINTNSIAGVDWHPNLRMEQNMITRGDLPRFVMDSYEECRGPPRLFLLDKYDCTIFVDFVFGGAVLT